MLGKMKLRAKAKLFKGFADSTRLSILECLKTGEKTVTEIVLETGQSQPNVSSHLRCLLDCGLVKNRRDGKTVLYRLRDAGIKELLENGDAVLFKVRKGISECTRY